MSKPARILVVFLVLTSSTFSSCLVLLDVLASGVASEMYLDANWYCTWLGTLVVYGNVTNNSDNDVQNIYLEVTIDYPDGTIEEEEISLPLSLSAGASGSFEERLYPVSDPQEVTMRISSAF